MINWQQLEIETTKIIAKNNQNVHIITGCACLDFPNKIYFNNTIRYLKSDKDKHEYTFVWVDELNNFEYQIPNLMYKIVITPYEIKSWMGFNNYMQTIYQVNTDYLEKMIESKILL
jgi:hypothetical protein